MKQKLLFPFVLLCCLHAFGQKEYNVWYFGNKAGITFNTNPPSALTNGKMNTPEGCSGICDENGNLLFYTNGDTVWNRNHQYLKNGISPVFYVSNSSIQAAMVVKKPRSKNVYYIFSCDANEALVGGYLRYWLIDMEKENGLGEAIKVSEPFLPNPLEGMAITKHANDTDFWIGTMDSKSGMFNVKRTEKDSFGVISSTDFHEYIGKEVSRSKFSPNGNLILSHSGYNFYVLCRFNRENGLLSNKLEINDNTGFIPFSAFEFSHDSRFLYVTTGKGKVVQYDLAVWDKTAIEQSAVTVHAYSGFGMRGMQLAPDRKIYIFKTSDASIDVINEPSQKGVGCNLQENVITLSGRENYNGSPYFPTFLYATFENALGEDLVLCEGDSAILSTKVSSGAAVIWSTGDTTKTIVAGQAGVYWVMATLNADTAIDSIQIKIGKKPIVYIGSDTAFCGVFSHIIDAGKNQKEYLWSSGDTTYSIAVNRPGIYSVTIKDSNACSAADTIDINQLLKPDITISYDPVSCDAVLLNAPLKQNGITYKWSTGDTTEKIVVAQTGKYILTSNTPFCSFSSSVMVNRLKIAAVDLGADTGLCGGITYTLNAGDGMTRYAWNTGSIESSIRAQPPGVYQVTVTDSNACEASDTITLTDVCDMRYYIPNSFTPNNDGLNDVFSVRGSYIENVQMQIFNRWGDKVYEDSGKDVFWNGLYKGKACQQDVYVYTITLTGATQGIQGEKVLTGNITLLR